MRLAVFAIWIASFATVSVSQGTKVPGFLFGAMIVVLPAATSYGPVLKSLMSRRSDTILATGFSIIAGTYAVVLGARSRLVDWQVLFMWVPTYQLIVLISTYRLFVRLTGRSPETVLLDLSEGKSADRLFYIATSLLLVIVPILLIGNFANTADS